MVKNSRDSINIFKLTELMLGELYRNRNIVTEKSATNFAEIHSKSIGCNYKSDIFQAVYNYAKLDTEYMFTLSIISIMYHTFEQLLSKILNPPPCKNKGLFQKCDLVLKEYGYNYKENSHYDIVEKYRLLTNSIKHGKIKQLKNKYPELINDDAVDGTILDNALNITNVEVDECLSGLIEYVEELYDYFDVMEYIE